MGRRQAHLFHSRKRRRERFARVGLPVSEVKIPGPDGAIADPLSGTQNERPVSLVMRVESFGVIPPSGILIQTGTLADALWLNLSVDEGSGVSQLELKIRESDVVVVSSGVTEIDIDLSSGIHTYVVAVDPVTGNRASVYVDGLLVIDVVAETPPPQFTSWADSGNTWSYADSMVNVGTVDPLELVFDKVPAIF